MDSNEIFIRKSPFRLFLFAALPGAISMLASGLYQMFDGMFVGQYLGEQPFAALNLAMPFVIINFSLADLIGVGSSVPISISLGQGDKERANNIFTCAVISIFLAGIGMGVVMYAAAPLLMQIMGANGEFASLAVQYLRVYALCSPVTTIVFATDNYLRISGRVRASMFLNIFMSALTVVLEYTFISVLHWGIRGAALGACGGMFICAVIALTPFALGRMPLKFVRPRFSGAMMKQIITCGSPNFLNNIAGRITSILMNMLLVRLGGENAVSIYGVLMYVDGFVQPLMYGTCDSLQPAVGYNWGAGRRDRVKAIERYCFGASAIICLVSAAIVFLFPGTIASIFLQLDGEAALASEAIWALQLFSATYLTRWFSFATQSYMLAVEESIPAAIISICTALVFPVILVAALWSLELTGLWLNFAGTSVLAGILSGAVLMRFRKKMKAEQ